MKEFGAGKINPEAAQRRRETTVMAQERTDVTLGQRQWGRRK